ncbi:MAG: hypothetical protein ACRDPC_05055 [Solirubrobacteraceae bacterium]
MRKPIRSEESPARRAGQAKCQADRGHSTLVAMLQGGAEDLDVVDRVGLEPDGEPAVQPPSLLHSQFMFNGLPDEIVREP